MHGDICMNLSGLLHSQLRGRSCRALGKDTTVRSGPNPQPGSTRGLFSYPDLVVLCGAIQFHDEREDVVLNPTVILEVLSKSTENFDRGEKFNRYRTWKPTLSDYLLVSQNRPSVEHYIRQADGSWSLYVFSGLEKSLFIKSINCELRLSDVYERIVFPDEAIEEDET